MSEETNTTEETSTEKRQYTPEEIATMRKNRNTFYREQIKDLKLEEEYERLQADIAEHKLRGYAAMVRFAQATMPPEEEEEEPVPQPKGQPETTNINKGPKGKTRTLKQD